MKKILAVEIFPANFRIVPKFDERGQILYLNINQRVARKIFGLFEIFRFRRNPGVNKKREKAEKQNYYDKNWFFHKLP